MKGLHSDLVDVVVLHCRKYSTQIRSALPYMAEAQCGLQCGSKRVSQRELVGTMRRYESNMMRVDDRRANSNLGFGGMDRIRPLQ